MVASLFGKTGHVASNLSNVLRSILSGTPQFLWRNSKNEQENANHYSPWQCELKQFGSKQRLFDRPKHQIDGLTAQPWLDTQLLLFISTHQENITWSTIFVKHQFLLNSFFKVTVYNTNDGRRQNVLSTIMLKNFKLSYKNVRLHWATPEICQARNLSSNPRK